MIFPRRILLIEHEPHFTALVGSALQATGRYLVLRESHGRRMLHAALHFQPDLILLDAPPDHVRIDEIARQIHASAFLNEVPILCLTNCAANGQISSIGLFGGYTFAANPVHLAELVASIAKLLKGQRPFGAAA